MIAFPQSHAQRQTPCHAIKSNAKVHKIFKPVKQHWYNHRSRSCSWFGPIVPRRLYPLKLPDPIRKRWPIIKVSLCIGKDGWRIGCPEPHAIWTFRARIQIRGEMYLTSIMVPLVSTPNWVYIGFWGFFLTLIIGNCTVTPSSGCVTFAWPKLADAAEVFWRLSYLLITQSHRPNKALILHGSSGEIWSNKRRLCDHSLPALLRRLLPSLHHLEHLIFRDSTDLGQRYRELCSLFSSNKAVSAKSSNSISPRLHHEIIGKDV